MHGLSRNHLQGGISCTGFVLYVRGFSAASVPGAGFYNFDPYVKRGMTLEQFIAATHAPFGSTDCSLPMRRAIDENLDVDVFIVMTDSETYAGADPNDRNTLNLAGFDASMPEIIAMFVRGEL